MSYYRKKIEYEREGPHASTQKSIIYLEEHTGTDHIRIYDENGNKIFMYGEFGEKDFWHQLKKLIDTPYHENDEVSDWNEEDINLIHKES